jgi:hypothetical protein
MSIATIKLALKNMLTEKDNETHCVFKWLSLLSVVVGLSLQAFSVIYLGQPFLMSDFGTGIGALFAGVGVALGFKTDSEPTTGI